MPPDQRLIVSEKQCRVAMMLCLDLQNRAWFEVAQKYAALDLRLHNVPVDVIAQVGVRLEQRDGVEIHGRLSYQTLDASHYSLVSQGIGRPFYNQTSFRACKVGSNPNPATAQGVRLTGSHDCRDGQNSCRHLQFVQVLAAEIGTGECRFRSLP